MLKSSKNPKELSMTIKGVFTALVPIIIMLAGVLGIDVAKADLTAFISQIATLAATAMVVYGGMRKAYNAVAQRFDLVTWN